MTSYSEMLHDDRFVIFLLHGVVRRSHHTIRNYTRKHLPIDDFVSFLRDVRHGGSPVSMNDVASFSTGKETCPNRAFAITFDDGFANNATIAAPILEELRIPATFYVSTAFVGHPARSWTDEIEAALEQTGPVRIEGIAEVVDGSYATPDAKIALMDRIRSHVKGSPSIDPYDFAARVVEQMSPADRGFDVELDQKLDRDQLRELAEHPLFSVGGHGHTHRILSFLTAEELEMEVSTSVRLLEEWTGRSVTHYSYPEGLAHCYSDSVIAALRRHGVVCAPTAEHGSNRPGDDLFRLKRMFVV